ncbi:MAG TPA: hypothetical protein VE262_12330 [Blastocatellia bacterium]|nr:hypothetical protein [Blastocatellia bacterium]
MLRFVINSILLSIVVTMASQGAQGSAQEAGDNQQAKAEALIREAIKARGGDVYLNTRSSVSRGNYTPFDKGVSTVPDSFVDYIVYPDRERTEFGKGKRRFVQVNSGKNGWVYEAANNMIRDQTEEQVNRFQQGLSYDLDYLLRRGWQEPGAKLSYLGRREPWRNTFSEAVRIEYKGGGSATLHLDPRTKLPIMTEYKIVVDGAPTENQARFFRWVEFEGRLVPTIIDYYRDGKQTARASFDSFSFNTDIPEKLFAKPSDVKEVK